MGKKPYLHDCQGTPQKLRDDGWVRKDLHGSHLQLAHTRKKGEITVPIHGGDIPKGTLNAILKQAVLK